MSESKVKKKGPKTEGQRQLLGVEGSESELAAKVGCGSAIIGHWRRGRRLPGESHRHKIELLFGIPRKAWDVAPGAELLEPDRGSAGAPPDTAQGGGDEDTLAITKAQIDAILTELDDETLTDAATAKLRDTLAKLLALRARLERDLEMSEDRVVREHPAWVATKAAILRALEPYPEAAAAVVRELEAAGS